MEAQNSTPNKKLSSDTEQILLSLETNKSDQVSTKERYRRMFLGAFFASVSFPLFVWFIFAIFSIKLIFLPFAFMYWFLLIWLVLVSWIRFRQAIEDIQDLDFEIDMLKYNVSSQESYAQKLVRVSNVQLRRYYNLNLNQNVWVFCLGIFCILIGVAVIGITLFLLLKVADDTETKIIAGAVGAIGSLLVNYVAAIYLKIHAEASSNLSSFHSRLVETHQMLLANSIVSRIKNEDKRWEAISHISINAGKKISDNVAEKNA